MIINIRGTNGSGKTTLARAFQKGQTIPSGELATYPKPTRKNPDAVVVVSGVCSMLTGDPTNGIVCCVGSYAQAQGGLDTVPSFEVQQEAVGRAGEIFDHVICEGILASTVAGSWLTAFDRIRRDSGQKVVIAYLDTPLAVCLQRIRARQERAGKVREIKEDLVADKIRAINATRPKFEAAGYRTITLPGDGPEAEKILRDLMMEGR